ncbi:MAG TPA: TadE/TadG family type IV pilus assembly protein [Syntrophales bacterium]|nr:TadE/TadG family type IV pilus assembly protein [Syntrophales bacterium]
MTIGNSGRERELGSGARRLSGYDRGASIVELAFILPILVLMVFAIVDFGRLIQARLVVANVSREGGSLASRVGIDNDVVNPVDDRAGFNTVMGLLLSSAFPLDITGADGKIYITRINAGFTKANPDPSIYMRSYGGSLAVASVITGAEGQTPAGLSALMHDHLTFQQNINDADIDNLTVVEVYYYYRPITPLPQLMKNMLLAGNNGLLIGSVSYF